MDLKCEKAIKITADYFRQFSRNGKWGTCVECPNDINHFVYPEFCKNNNRADHNLNVDELAEIYKHFISK